MKPTPEQLEKLATFERMHGAPFSDQERERYLRNITAHVAPVQRKPDASRLPRSLAKLQEAVENDTRTDAEFEAQAQRFREAERAQGELYLTPSERFMHGAIDVIRGADDDEVYGRIAAYVAERLATVYDSRNDVDRVDTALLRFGVNAVVRAAAELVTRPEQNVRDPYRLLEWRANSEKERAS